MEILEQKTLEDNSVCILAKDSEGDLYHDLIFPSGLTAAELTDAINNKIAEIVLLKNKNRVDQ